MPHDITSAIYTHTIKKNTISPAGRKKWSFIIYFKCLLHARLLEDKRKLGTGGFKREETYVCLWLIHTVWQKPTQYCKATMLQLKIIF